jgi:hypothetical protein
MRTVLAELTTGAIGLGDCVMNVQIPFPGSGQQKEFVRKFEEALSNAGYRK